MLEVSSGVEDSPLLREQQMPWEVAVTQHPVGSVFGQQEDLVALLQLDDGGAAGRDVTLLLWAGERVRDQLAVTHQIHTGVFVADGTVEVELIYTWMLAGEKPLLDVVAVLVVVDGDTEGNGLAGWGEIVAQTHGEGYFGCAARRGRTAYSTWMGKKKNNYTNRSFSLQFLNSSICGVVDNRQLLQKIKRENPYF